MKTIYQIAIECPTTGAERIEEYTNKRLALDAKRYHEATQNVTFRSFTADRKAR